MESVSLMNLKCLTCGLEGLVEREAAWWCEGCGAAFPIVRSIPRFVDTEIYSGSFGFQWNRFSQTQLDSANGRTRSRDTFVEKTGWDLERLRGARILDAGCGMGRFAEIAADAGAEVHAIDLSSAVEAAAKNLADRPDVHVYQADIMNLPFPEASFDYIYSIGVLHHTPNTEQAFRSLVPLLKPGGEISIWVYSTKLRLMVGSTVLRLLTPKLPKRFLLATCRLAVPLYWLHRLPLVGFATRSLLPTSMEAEPDWRWLDTFDWYSPRYQWKHSEQEVVEWFEKAGLEGLEVGRFPVSLRGVRPAHGPLRQ